MHAWILAFLTVSPLVQAGFVYDFEVTESARTLPARIPAGAREFGITLKDSPFKCVLKTDEVEKAGHLSANAELWCCAEKPTLSQCAVSLSKCTKEDDGNLQLVLVEIVTPKEKAKDDKKPAEELRRATIGVHCMYLEDRETTSEPPAEAANDSTSEQPQAPNTPQETGAQTLPAPQEK